MNLNQRRPLSTKVQKFNKPTKRDVIDACIERGEELFISKHNVGEWNECRIFHCGGVELAHVMKSERPNWGEMLIELGEGEKWGLA